eukprot:GHVN01102988.1.p3 GENE.GHVN01102988.1~~GHVN01102988.1.p3  ORF type:complete len:100 (-),score=14.93 GHVN01102988.1:729-1028(-)
MEVRVGGKYRLGRKIGSGSFGDIYIGTNMTSNDEVAIKLEAVKSKHPQLLYESKLYKILTGGSRLVTHNLNSLRHCFGITSAVSNLHFDSSRVPHTTHA